MTQNVQPFYHRVTLLFTSTGESEERFQEFLNLNQTDEFFQFEIEEWEEPEPGDPADLL